MWTTRSSTSSRPPSLRWELNLHLSLGQKTFDSGVWSRMAPADRASIVRPRLSLNTSLLSRSGAPHLPPGQMSSIARLLASRVPSLAILESMQTGRPLREMSTQLQRLPEWFEYFGALCRTEEGAVQPTRGNLLNYVRREPLGVVTLLTSFNHPMLISVKKLGRSSSSFRPGQVLIYNVSSSCTRSRELRLPQALRGSLRNSLRTYQPSNLLL